jgi:GNAT superfamily N-acetyltransferase
MSPGAPLRIAVQPFDHPDVDALVVDIQQFYVDRYGTPDEDSTPPEDFVPPRGLFLVAYLDGVAVGCGGWRRLDAQTVEIKRMWVSAAARGTGVARQLLAELETRAAQAGARSVTLNTGYLQTEAMALYDSSGYLRTNARYGHYADIEGAFFFIKSL